MIKNSFLSKWEKPNQYLFILGFIALLVNVGLFSYHYAIGPEGHLDWLITSETESIQAPIINFQKLFHNHTINGTSYIIYEKFEGSPEPISIGNSIIFLSFILLAFNFAFVAITRIKNQLLFSGGMLLLFLFIATLRLGELEVLGSNIILLTGLICLIYGGIGYWFYSSGNKISPIKRFLISSFITIALTALVGSLSNLPYPALHVTNAGHIPLGILSLLFIVIIAFDILNGFFYLSTNSKSVSSKSNLINFIMISTLYLGSLTLIFLQRVNFIDWDLKLFDPYYLLAVSAIIGIWSHRKRALRFQSIIPFQAGSSFIYLALGIICFATFYYAFATFNDGFIKVYKDVVLYSHLFIGVTYFFYILINFYPQIKKNLPAHKFEYDPNFLRLSFVRVAGCLLWLVIVQKTSQNVISQWKSGYYSLWGDLYKKQSEKYFENGNLKDGKTNYNFAKTYYNLGYGTFLQNHKATYNLAKMSADAYADGFAKEDFNDAKMYYEAMIKCEFATPHSYINYSNFIWHHTHSKQDQREILQKGLSKSPTNGYLQNNYALTFRDMVVFRDSVKIYLNQAKSNTNSDFVPTTNLIAFNYQFEKTDLDEKIYNDHLSYLPVQINLLASSLTSKKTIDLEFNEKSIIDSSLTNENFLYLNNYILSNIETLDAKQVDLSKFMNHPSNEFLHKELVELNAHLQLNRGDKYRGKYDFVYLAEAATELEQVDIHKRIGLYLLKEDDLVNARKWFTKARDAEKYQFKIEAQFYEALIQGRLGNKAEAYNLLNGIVSIDTLEYYSSAHAMHKALKSELDVKITLDGDQEKLWYLLFNAHNFDTPHVYMLTTMEDPDIKTQAIAEIIPTLLANNRLKDAENLLEYVPNEFTQKLSAQELNYAQLRLLEAKGEAQKILDYLDKADLTVSRSQYIPYFRAFASDILNDSSNTKELYIKALASSSFDEETLYRGLKYLTDHTNEEELAYDIALNASLSSPESIIINQLYVYVATNNIYFQLAESVLEDLEDLMEAEEFELFKEEIENLKQKRLIEEGMEIVNTSKNENLY